MEELCPQAKEYYEAWKNLTIGELVYLKDCFPEEMYEKTKEQILKLVKTDIDIREANVIELKRIYAKMKG